MVVVSEAKRWVLVLLLLLGKCLTYERWGGRLRVGQGGFDPVFRLYATATPKASGTQGSSAPPPRESTDKNVGRGQGDARKKKTARFIHPQVFKMFQRAQYLMRNGDNVVAQKLLVRCLELNPFDSHSWLALARLEAKLGNYERAREIFSHSIARCPNNVHLLHAWGHLEQKHGDEAVARECWSKAMDLDPLNAYVCHALATLEQRHRNFERAKEVLQTVVKVKPTSALCVSLAELEQQMGFPEKAREVLRYGLAKCDSERSKVLLALAWLEEDSFGREKEAQQLMDEAMVVDGKNMRVFVAKASMELRMKKVEAARKTLRTAAQLEVESQDDGQHYTMWATLELEAGNVKEARRVLEEGSKRYPGDQFILQRWGALEMKYGAVSKARELFDRSVTIQPHAPTFVAWAILEDDEGRIAMQPTHRYNKFETVDDSDPDITDVPTLADPAIANLLAELTKNVERDKGEREGSRLQSSKSLLEPSSSKLFTSLGGHAILDTQLAVNISANEFAAAQLAKARQLLNIGMLVDPQHGPIYHAFGNMELRHGNITGAREVLMKGILNNSTDIESLYHAWGMLELKDNRRREAGEIFRRGIELGLRGNKEVDNGVSFLLHSLGMLEADNHRPEEAKKVFSTGVSLFPKHSQLLLGLAIAMMALGEHDAAREKFKAAVDADPYHAHAWQSWAIAEKQCGNLELAKILFRQGLKKVPHHGALWQAFGVLEMQQGNFDVARTLFSQSLQRCPGHAQSYQAWACLEVRMGNLIKAKALALEGIRRAPSHPALWTVAGLIEDKLGNHTKAKRLFETGIERFPGHGSLYKVLGEQYERQGAFLQAREVFHKGLSQDPYCAQVYHAAALLEARLGNLEVSVFNDFYDFTTLAPF